MIGVVALVGDGVFARLDRGEQRRSALDVSYVSAGQQEGAWSSFAVDEGMDLGRAAAARAADGLVFGPPFWAPLAERCAFTAELSIMVSPGGSAHSTRAAANRRCHRPRRLQRLYRLKTVVYGPYSSGSARHRQPSRNRWMIPLIMRRSSCRSGPVWTIGRCGASAANCSSVSQKLSATNQALHTDLNHNKSPDSIGYRP